MKRKVENIKEKIFNINAVFSEEADGGYSVSVPSLPGCFSQGDFFEEATRNIKEAIELYLEGDYGESLATHKAKREFVVPVTVHG